MNSDPKPYNRNAIRKECSKQLQIAGFTHIAYNLIIKNDRGRVVIPLAVLDEDGNPSVAIRIRKPTRNHNQTISKRSQNIQETAGCYVVVVRSHSDAVRISETVKALFT